jgi:small subunit ribosomal protein S2
MAIVTMRQLLDSGVHFGHQTRRWNPKMKRFILTERNGIYIIDLGQTLSHIDTAYEFIKDTVAKGGTMLFVGTKKQAQEAVQEQATRVGMPYVNQRWLGGMLTNFHTISKRLSRLKELEDMNLDDATGSTYTKKERLMMSRERDKLSRTLGGIRTMAKLPAAVWIVDTKKEHLAVDEARKLGIPVVAILDTNADPEEAQYPIPGNDDAIRAVGLLTRVVADAVAEGLLERHAVRDTAAEGTQSAEEPLAEWEKELLAGGANSADVDVSAVQPQTSAVAQAEETIDGRGAIPVTEVDAPPAPAPATDGGTADVVAAQAGSLPGVEVTEESAETPLQETVSEATHLAADAVPAAPAPAAAPQPKAAAPTPAKPAAPSPAPVAAPAEAAPAAQAPAAETKPAAAESKAPMPKAPQPKAPEAKKPEPKAEAAPAKPAEPKPAEPKADEAKAEAPKAAEAKPAKETKAADEKPAAPAKAEPKAEAPAKAAKAEPKAEAESAKEAKPADDKPAAAAKAEPKAEAPKAAPKKPAAKAAEAGEAKAAAAKKTEAKKPEPKAAAAKDEEAKPKSSAKAASTAAKKKTAEAEADGADKK